MTTEAERPHSTLCAAALSPPPRRFTPRSPVRSTVEVIAAKRDGGALSDGEIRSLIDAFAKHELPDYQMAAMAMAVFFQGLNDREMRTWTDAMMRSGAVLDLSSLGPGRVDKHSTGGVGDKISLPLAPAAAACGVTVPMIAGRGLGHTGGTVDKLGAIPGYTTDLTTDAFVAQLEEIGCAIMGQTSDIAPADRRLYHLRDVTGTVEIIPLIAASIMSKKLAEGIEGLVLDVKVGRGAFMKTLEDARELADMMISVGAGMGVKVIAYLTRMEEPLGRMVGNAVEVVESLDILQGGGPPDVRELVVTLGGAMVELALDVDPDDAKARIAAALDDGRALARFEAMVRAQGGRLEALPAPTGSITVRANQAGYIAAIDGLEIGLAGVALGAGRARSEDTIDPVVGIHIDAVRGARVEVGDPLATVLFGDGDLSSSPSIGRIEAAFSISDSPPTPAPLILERRG